MYKIVGTKIRKLREDMGLTQEQLGKSVGLSSEFISLLELGKRAPSLESLSSIARFLKKDISFFMVEREESFNQLLRKEKLDKRAIRILRKLKKYANGYLMLEDLTGKHLNLAPLYTNITAEKMAEQERRRLGLGRGPIRNLFSLLEFNGLRLYRHPIPEDLKIAGVYIFIELRQAALALVNSDQSLGRQVFTAAHEYSHYLKNRYDEPVIHNPDIFVDEYISLYHPRESFARRFASHFLMPRESVEEIVGSEIGKSRLDFEDVLFVKRYFGVSVLDMLDVLKEMGYISPTKWKEYQKKDAEKHEIMLFGDVAGEEGKRRKGALVSERYIYVALDAFRKKKINQEKLAKFIYRSQSDVGSLLKR